MFKVIFVYMRKTFMTAINASVRKEKFRFHFYWRLAEFLKNCWGEAVV
jgi:hypothetical protein